ncbi:MAG: 1,4-beta-xylanase, partial [Clostridia bacterium]|nr:1,4-beta-xylanase [Clostridia bacterium]
MTNSMDRLLNGVEGGFLNAYTYGFCEKRGFTQGVAWRRSLEAMARSTGCNAVILPVCAWQAHPWSTEMDSDSPDVMSAEDVDNVCAHARALGLKVILKAMVNCRDGAWRAFIHFFDPPVPTEPCWADWFAAWTEHVCRVADMARASGADMLCVGCELVGADGRAEEWRALIREVRARYDGPITY